MKKLAVPLRLQTADSKDCGAICTQMVLEYYGIEKDAQSITEMLTYYPNGTSAYDNGSIIINEGLKVQAVTAQPFLFAADIIPNLKSNEDIIALLETKMLNTAIGGYIPTFKEGIQKCKQFILDGGIMKLEIPAFKHIKNAIDADQPVIALLFGGALGTKQGGYHFVVVAGYDENNVFIVNPLPNSKREAWFPIEHFLYAVHSSTTYDTDNGTLLIVSR